MHETYLSHVKEQITVSRKDICLVLVYGITEHPMMLDTNKEIRSKEDVIKVARMYFSCWKIEEYFRCKKQMFQFENFRIRKLSAINALNFYITLCMAFLAHISMKPETNALKVSIIQEADPVKKKNISAIIGWAKASLAYSRMQKKALYNSELLSCYKEFLDYSLGWELLDNQKRQGVPNYYEYHYVFSYPTEFNHYIRTTLKLLLDEQAKLIKQSEQTTVGKIEKK